MTSFLNRTVALWLAGLAAATAVPAALGGAAAAPRNGLIAFAIQFNTLQLYSLRMDGSPVRRLTTDLGNNYQPVASPDGHKIAFTRGPDDGRAEIFVMNRDGSGLTNLTRSNGNDYDPMWSHDGRRIAFTSHRTGDDETYVMNADGSNVRRVTRSRGDDENPSWLRDGRRLVISSTRVGKKISEIYVVRIADGRAVRLTHDKRFAVWPQVSPDGRWISYTTSKQEDASGDIVVMRADGSQRRRVTRGSVDDGYASWSPDSRRLIFTRGDTLSFVDRDGRNLRRVDPVTEGRDVFWARDGTIFFDNSDYDNEEIAIVDPQGGGMKLLTEAPGDDDVEPHWSPDGALLAYQSDATGDDEIWVMNADGSDARNVSQAPRAEDEMPVWSPDGTKIAFTSDRGFANDDAEIVVMNSDGSHQVSITRSPANDSEPAWSPDGRRIAFARFAGERGDIWVMDADGSNQVRLTTSAATDVEPAWSPDGTKILFMSSRGGGAEIWVMNADGSGQRSVVASGFIDAEPSWSPDGTKIVFDRNTRDGIDIVVADADGSDQRVVTRACAGNDCDESYVPDPSWQPVH
jgi:Tol biopolymer transport system component